MSRPKALIESQVAQLMKDRTTMSYKELGRKHSISKSSAWNYCQSVSKSPVQVDSDSKPDLITTVQETTNDTDFQPSLLFQGEYGEGIPQGTRRHTQNFVNV